MEQGFYERLRERIKGSLKRVVKRLGPGAVEVFLLIPDTFVLITRLLKDPRVKVDKKIKLGALIGYWVLPADLLPDITFAGYLDDLLISLYVIINLFTDTEMEILKENWPGDPVVIERLREYAAKVEGVLSLIGGNLPFKAKRFVEDMLKIKR